MLFFTAILTGSPSTASGMALRAVIYPPLEASRKPGASVAVGYIVPPLNGADCSPMGAENETSLNALRHG